MFIKQSHNFDNAASYLLKENSTYTSNNRTQPLDEVFELHHIGFERQTKKAINQFYFSGGKNRKGG